jgi:hypothetical protein
MRKSCGFSIAFQWYIICVIWMCHLKTMRNSICIQTSSSCFAIEQYGVVIQGSTVSLYQAGNMNYCRILFYN